MQVPFVIKNIVIHSVSSQTLHNEVNDLIKSTIKINIIHFNKLQRKDGYKPSYKLFGLQLTYNQTSAYKI